MDFSLSFLVFLVTWFLTGHFGDGVVFGVLIWFIVMISWIVFRAIQVIMYKLKG